MSEEFEDLEELEDDEDNWQPAAINRNLPRIVFQNDRCNGIFVINGATIIHFLFIVNPLFLVLELYGI